MNSLVKHYEECYLKHGDCAKGVDWPDKESAEARYRVMYEIIKYDPRQPQHIPGYLDYGCGLGHFWTWLSEQKVLCGYVGYDLSKLFIEECKKKYANKFWYTKNPPKMDYVIMNGVFTERDVSEKTAWYHMEKEIYKAWHLCNHGLAFNTMNELTDKNRRDLFRVNLNRVTSIVTNMSDCYIVRNDYLKYERTIYVYKKP